MSYKFRNVLFGLLAFFTVSSSTLTFATEVKNARSNDLADNYLLEKNGDFFRTVGKNKCQITSGVDSFKVSQHPHDRAMVYFVKNGDLYSLANDSQKGTSNCPQSTYGTIMKDVKKYSVVSNSDTTIVNVALSYSGILLAWDNARPVLSESRVDAYKMNQKYGVKKAPFNSYVFFAINSAGYVLKAKGQEPSESKFDVSQTYNSLDTFFERNNLK